MKMITHIKAKLQASNKDVAKKKIQYSFKNDNRYLSTPSFSSNEKRRPPFDLQQKNVPRFPWRHGDSPASSHAPGQEDGGSWGQELRLLHEHAPASPATARSSQFGS